MTDEQFEILVELLERNNKELSIIRRGVQALNLYTVSLKAIPIGEGLILRYEDMEHCGNLIEKILNETEKRLFKKEKTKND